MHIGSVEHFSFLILSRSLTSKAWVSQKAESSCAETMGETPRTPSPSGRFFTKSSITVSENESKLLQSCIQSAAQGTSDNKKVAQILFQEQKASLLAKTQLGAWWAAKGHLHRARREEARFQTRTDQPMQCWHGKLWKTMCKGKETLLANHKEQEFSQKKKNRKKEHSCHTVTWD